MHVTIDVRDLDYVEAGQNLAIDSEGMLIADFIQGVRDQHRGSIESIRTWLVEEDFAFLRRLANGEDRSKGYPLGHLNLVLDWGNG